MALTLLFFILQDPYSSWQTVVWYWDMLGYIVRKQPTWLQHLLIKDHLRLLKTVTDVFGLVTSIPVLVSLLLSSFCQTVKIILRFSVSCACTIGRQTPPCRTFPAPTSWWPSRLIWGFIACFRETSSPSWGSSTWIRFSSGSSLFADIISFCWPQWCCTPCWSPRAGSTRRPSSVGRAWTEEECSRYSLYVYESASREDMGLVSLWSVAGDSHTLLLNPGLESAIWQHPPGPSLSCRSAQPLGFIVANVFCFQDMERESDVAMRGEGWSQPAPAQLGQIAWIWLCLTLAGAWRVLYSDGVKAIFMLKWNLYFIWGRCNSRCLIVLQMVMTSIFP